MTPDRDALLEEVRAALQKATPGPWEWLDTVMVGDIVRTAEDGQWPDEYATDGAERVEGGWRRRIIETDSGFYPPRDADAALIAGAPVWLAQLCDRVDSLRAERDALRAAGQALVDALDRCKETIAAGGMCLQTGGYRTHPKPYDGPTYWKELEVLRARLTAPPSDPT